MAREEANRLNILDQPHFFDGAVALLGPERDQFLRDYKFDITPTTDDRPYFFDFFKWRALPELLERRALGIALLDCGSDRTLKTYEEIASITIGSVCVAARADFKAISGPVASKISTLRATSSR